MISVEEARSAVLRLAVPAAPQRCPLTQSLGRVLAEDIASDVDSPPHDKSLVDGYALQAGSVQDAPFELRVIEEVTAGKIPTAAVSPGMATRVMTGAPIPVGANAVVMVEDTELTSSEVVLVRRSGVRAGQHIMSRGASLRCGEVVLTSGHVLRPLEIGLLAEVGATQVQVVPPPSVAVLSTGNELVAADRVPEAGQIRNSNGAMLDALVSRAGGTPVNLGIGRDNAADLKEVIQTGLAEQVVVVSGGVSAGVLDLVPGVLAELGVEQVFHKVNLKPGKPLWFGSLPSGGGDRLVFGLPGNPVSSLVCFELFVRPALRKLAGHCVDDHRGCPACLSVRHKHRGDRPTFWPAMLKVEGASTTVTPLQWQGSADLRSLTSANCLVKFPASQHDYQPGEAVEVFPL